MTPPRVLNVVILSNTQRRVKLRTDRIYEFTERGLLMPLPYMADEQIVKPGDCCEYSFPAKKINESTTLTNPHLSCSLYFRNQQTDICSDTKSARTLGIYPHSVIRSELYF